MLQKSSAILLKVQIICNGMIVWYVYIDDLTII